MTTADSDDGDAGTSEHGEAANKRSELLEAMDDYVEAVQSGDFPAEEHSRYAEELDEIY